MLARPYAQMLSNVLESLVRRTDLYNDADRRHDASAAGRARREECSRRRRRRRQGICRSLQLEHRQGGAELYRCAPRSRARTIDIEPIGRKARDMFRKRYPAPIYEKKEEHYDNDLATHFEVIRHRAAADRGDGRPSDDAAEDRDSMKYRRWPTPSSTATTRSEIDSVYLVYNEFKSVISQRVVVEKLLPIRKLGSHEITVAEVMTRRAERSGGPRGAAPRASPSTSLKSRCSTPRRRSSAPPRWTTSSISDAGHGCSAI